MDQPQRPEPAAAQASRYVGAGLTMALSIGLFLYLGTAADRWLDSQPWFTLLGTFVGAAAGFWYMYHHLVLAPRRRDEERRSGS